MKITKIAAFGIGLLIPFFQFAQSDNFIKDYQAPDYKFRSLIFSGSGIGRGVSNQLNENNIISFAGNANYFQRNNTRLYQGYLSSRFDAGFGYREDTVTKFLNLSTRITNLTSNRFFWGNNWYAGVHDFSMVSLNHFEQIDFNFNTTFFLWRMNPTISLGQGRLEPVSFARAALDIEKLLMKDGVFDSEMTDDQRKELADKIAVVNNKRFYDVRLGRIYRIEAIDSLIEDFGLVNDKGMGYYSRLQDAYFYSVFNGRQSGYQHEFGLVTRGIFDFNDLEFDEGLGGFFYSFTLHKPINYAMQHTVSSKFITSIQSFWWQNDYAFGFYPNTRTELTVGIAATGFYSRANIFSAEQWGYNGRAYADFYYYITPRFRFNGKFALNMNEDYVAHEFMFLGNDRQITNLPYRNLNYNFSLGLQFALF